MSSTAVRRGSVVVMMLCGIVRAAIARESAPRARARRSSIVLGAVLLTLSTRTDSSSFPSTIDTSGINAAHRRRVGHAHHVLESSCPVASETAIASRVARSWTAVDLRLADAQGEAMALPPPPGGNPTKTFTSPALSPLDNNIAVGQTTMQQVRGLIASIVTATNNVAIVDPGIGTPTLTLQGTAIGEWSIVVIYFLNGDPFTPIGGTLGGFVYEVTGLEINITGGFIPGHTFVGQSIQVAVLTNPLAAGRAVTIDPGSLTWKLNRKSTKSYTPVTSNDSVAFAPDGGFLFPGYPTGILSTEIDSPGTYTVSVTGAAANPTVESAPFTVEGFADFSLTPDCLGPGLTSNISAWEDDNNGSYAWDDMPLTFSTSSNTSPGYTTFASSGVTATLTAQASIPEGLYVTTVTVADANDARNSTSASVDILSSPLIANPEDIQTIQILGAPSFLEPGASVQMTAMATLKNGTSQPCPAHWTYGGSGSPGAFFVGGETGNPTAPPGTGPGGPFITAASVTYTESNDVPFHGQDFINARICDVFAPQVMFDVAYPIQDFDTDPLSPINVAPGGTVVITPTRGGQALNGFAFLNQGDPGTLTVQTPFTQYRYAAPAKPAIATLNVWLGRLSDPLFTSFKKTFTIFVASSFDQILTLLSQQVPPGRAAVTNPADPVFTFNGEEYREDVDIFVRGRGEANLEMRRCYCNQIAYNGPLGHRWDFELNEHLFFQPSGDVTRQHMARIDTYALQSNGSYASPAGFFNRLIKQPDGSFVLREPSGFKRTFDSSGKLKSRTDRNGNSISLTYNGNGQLFQAIDPFGRTLTFAWQADGRLHSVSDFTSRVVTYSYDAHFDLTSVTSPAVTGTSTSNDFPAGVTTKFGYSSGFADDTANHNLNSVTAPNEAANNGPPFHTVVYGTDPTNTLTYNRVIASTTGGTNGSGITAGGTSTLQFGTFSSSVAAVASGYPAGVVNTTTVKDAAGNVTAYGFDASGRPLVVKQFTHGVRASDPSEFDTTYRWNSDSLPTLVTLPLGNQIQYLYDSSSSSRFAQANLLEVDRIPDAVRSGGDPLVWTMTYEPLFQQLATVTDPRGNATGFTPPVGTASKARYTSTFRYDYEESSAPVPEAVAWSIDLSSVPRGLGDLNGDGRTDQVNGNLVEANAPTVTLLDGSHEANIRGTTAQKIRTRLVWNDVGQYVQGIDPEGNITAAGYYPENSPDGGATVAGNTSTQPRGYMKTLVRDAGPSPDRTEPSPPALITTTFTYDPVGHVTGVLNPRGIKTTFEWTALDALVSTTRAQDVSQALANGQLLLQNQAFAYKTRRFYDANGNVIKTQVENRDGNTPDLGQQIETTLSFDILNEPLSVTGEIDATHTVTTSFRYTPNELLALVTKPEGNKVQTLYDERNRFFQRTRGYGSTTTAPSTVTINYDLNGSTSQIVDPQHKNADGTAAVVSMTRDGFDRPTKITDEIGGYLELAYDPASMVIKRQFFGHPANKPGDPVTLLSESRVARDELSRAFEIDMKEFLAEGFTPKRTPTLHKGSLTPLETVAPSSDGTFVTTRVEFDALSRRTFLTEDDKQTWQWIFDGASRITGTIDPVGNARVVAYDQNSNPTNATSFEISPEGLVPQEIFVTLYVWDALDRLNRVTDNAGQTATLTYDSRDQLTDTSDAVGPLVSDPLNLYTKGKINSAGNTCHYFHDGLRRTTKKVCDLRVGGQGGNALDTSNPASSNGTITATYQWDMNSRLKALFDDKSNGTLYDFDDLDRPTKETAADNTFRKTDYDLDDNPIKSTDANGTVVERAFDNLNRLAGVTVTRSTVWKVGGTVGQTLGYDGASRLTKATDTTELGATSEVVYVYDSLSRVLEEAQDGEAVDSEWAGDGRRLELTYGSGTKLTFDHDANKRLKDIKEETKTVAHWDWIGPGMRPLRRAVENGATLSFLDDEGKTDIGWDSVQRAVRMRYVRERREEHGTRVESLIDLGYTYDRADNRTSETRFTEGQQDLDAYDSVYRLANAQYAQTIAGTEKKDGDREAGDDGRRRNAILGLVAEVFKFDSASNRTSLVDTLWSPRERDHDKKTDKDDQPKTVTTSYDVNSTNEYTKVGGLAQSHDANGNLLDDGRFTYRYDFRNLLIELTENSSRRTLKYRYDALGRRIEKVFQQLVGDGRREDGCEEHGHRHCGENHTRRFVFDGARVLEEKDPHGAVSREFIYGVGLDEPLRMTTKHDGRVSTVVYFAQNAIGSVVALMDGRGTVLERYRYLAFGKEEILDAEGNRRDSSAFGNSYGFQGRWRDFEEGSPLTYFRARYYDPETGRFTSRDPIGAWGDRSQVGNGYGAFGNDPLSRLDVFGLCPSTKTGYNNTTLEAGPVIMLGFSSPELEAERVMIAQSPEREYSVDLRSYLNQPPPSYTTGPGLFPADIAIGDDYHPMFLAPTPPPTTTQIVVMGAIDVAAQTVVLGAGGSFFSALTAGPATVTITTLSSGVEGETYLIRSAIVPSTVEAGGYADAAAQMKMMATASEPVLDPFGNLLNAQLTLETVLQRGGIQVIEGGDLAIGQGLRTAVFDVQTGTIYVGQEGMGIHFGVAELATNGAEQGERFVSGFISVDTDGVPLFRIAGASSTYPATQAVTGGKNIYDLIRGTGVRVVGK